MATKRKAPAAALLEDTEMIVLDDIEIKKEPDQESENYELDMKPTAVDKASEPHIMFL